MKKLFAFLVLTTLLALFVAPVVMAREEIPNFCTISRKVGVSDCDGTLTGAVTSYKCYPDNNSSCGLCCLLNTVYTVTNWIFFLMMALAVVLIVIGGAMYMLSGGDTTKAGKGKSLITYALIGLVIALVAKFVPPIVKFILGVS